MITDEKKRASENHLLKKKTCKITLHFSLELQPPFSAH